MTILLLETLHPDAHVLLAGYDQVVLAETPEAQEEASAAGSVQAILTRGKGRITAALMDRCAGLRAVARCGVGLDNVDTAAAGERGIPVIYAPGSTTQAVAEHTLMLMLALSRGLRPLANQVHAGNWAVRNGYESFELCGRTLGIVGAGAIGSRVAEIARAIGMQVVYWSRSSQIEGCQRLELAALLREADVVSLHVALVPATRGLIGERELALMQPHALLINTTRGAVVDQAALARALDEQRLGGFASDVLVQEPPDPADPLLHNDRVLITPHTAALTDRTYREICVRTARNVLAVLRGEQPETKAVYQQSAA